MIRCRHHCQYLEISKLSKVHANTVRSADRFFTVALAIGTVGITIRSAYRVAELQAGFHSHLFNEEVLFMLLEGTVMSIVGITLTAFHPGLVFGKKWTHANFSLRKG